MPSPPPQKSDPIIVVGAGVFGLSTALHLAQRGYTDVTLFDAQPYDATLYSPLRGCDAASADINKIVRCGYGAQSIYQALALEALEGWKAWNAEIASGQGEGAGLTREDRVFVNCGELAFSDDGELGQFDVESLKGMEAAGHRHALLVVGDERCEGIARERGFTAAMDPFGEKRRSRTFSGVLDTLGGLAVADKACRYALHKARSLGVKTVLDPVAGAFKSLNDAGSGERVVGICTKDGKTHPAAVTVLACGAWTPSLLPEMDGLCEATAGSVAMLKIPQESPLRARFSPDVFPTWAWNMRHGAEGGLYGFPIDESGWLKIGYRGTKYTNPVIQDDGKERSLPIRRTGEPVPEKAMAVLQSFLERYLPELQEAGIGISNTRLCWYTDSFDNHLVIDRVPGKKGLVVATGGSGHAFKYLPCLGQRVIEVIEGVGLDSPAIKAWAWRCHSAGSATANVLMEGSRGPRALNNVKMAGTSAAP